MIMRTTTTMNYAMIGMLICSTAQATDYSAVLTAPPQNVPTYYMPDGPLLGNGDVGVVLAGPPEEQRFYIGKNDWWGYGDGSGAMPAGGLTLAIPELKGASYRQEQDLALAEVRRIVHQGRGDRSDQVICRCRLKSADNGIDVCRQWAGDGPVFAENRLGRSLGSPQNESSQRHPVLHAGERGCASRKKEGHGGGDAHYR